MLVDAEGPFGNPTSDSLRTCITLGHDPRLVVAYAPAGYAAARLASVLDRTAATLTQACGGTAGSSASCRSSDLARAAGAYKMPW